MENFLARPQVTVLMPVYNSGNYLAEALESILDQSFSDFEFLIINDGSTDQSVNIISSYHDPRIRLIHNDGNLGLVYSLNRGLDLAHGQYIARMDSDDISLPERLSKQVLFMNDHPEVGVCGGLIEYFMGKQMVLQLPIDDAAIKQVLLSYNPMAHPTVMFRASMLKRHKIRYNQEYQHVEDYELWTRLATLTRFANLPEILLKYRIHPEQIGGKYSVEQEVAIRKIKTRFTRVLHNLNITSEDDSPITSDSLDASQQWWEILSDLSEVIGDVAPKTSDSLDASL